MNSLSQEQARAAPIDMLVLDRSSGEGLGQAASGNQFPAPPQPRGPWYRLGEWLRAHQRAIRRAQWLVVSFYLILLLVPVALPLPDSAARVHTNITLFAQFLFWGVWWPFVLLSIVIMGRTWCGMFCPEGSLSEFASRHGRARSVPRWITWGGWPFVAFCLTTIYGQLISVYQYPAPVLLILGGSTVAAMVVGFLYGREKRVWCRYLCPVSGVFALLAKLSPLHYGVDATAWRAANRDDGTFFRFNCAPLVPVATMKGGSQCHMCGRCSGFRDAIALTPRSPSHEIVHVAGHQSKPWETALILYGMLGVAVGSFHWSSSSMLISAKQMIAGWLIQKDVFWPLEHSAPWWLLTNYPAQNDVLNLLDGALILLYIGLVTAVVGTSLSGLIALATRFSGLWSQNRFHHLSQALVPIAGCGVFLGLSSITVSMLRSEGIYLSWANELRAILLLGSWLWSLLLAHRILNTWSLSLSRHATALCLLAGSGALAAGAWASLFWSL